MLSGCTFRTLAQSGKDDTDEEETVTVLVVTLPNSG